MAACDDFGSKKESLIFVIGGPLPFSESSGGVLNPDMIVFGGLIFDLILLVKRIAFDTNGKKVSLSAFRRSASPFDCQYHL